MATTSPTASRLALLALVVMIAACHDLRAQDDDTEGPTREETEVLRAIEDLGAAEWSTRAAARDVLARHACLTSARVEAALLHACSSITDPEVRASAAESLRCRSAARMLGQCSPTDAPRDLRDCMDLSELLRALLAGDADGAVSIARANPRVAAGVLERYVNDVVPWSNRCDPSENPVGLPGALAPIGPCGEQGPPFRPPFDPFMEHLTRGHLGLGDAAGALHVALLHLDREDARARVHALLRTMCCVEASWPVEKEAQADHVLTPEEEAQISEARENHGIWGAWIHDVVRGTDAWGERVAPATIIDVLDAVGDKSTIRLAYRAVRCQPDWEWNGVRPLLDWVLRHRDADAVVELVRDDWAGTLFGYAELRPSLRSGRLARLNHRLYRKGVISRDEYIRNAKTMQENRTTR